ncbi:hypothetical protein KC968_03860 [Candidatus Saccharibacteria bacterium]|nr:hypothetical protein [Candidatus Saccharibacteria bacterium]
MTSKKVFFVLSASLVVVLLGSLTATIYGVKLLKKSGDELTNLKVENQALINDKQTISKAKDDIEKYEHLETIAKSIVPQEKDQAKTVREIIAIADKTSVPLDSISFPESELGQKKGKNDKKTAAPSGFTQITPVKGITGVYVMPITVNSKVDQPVQYSQVLSFLQNLEQNRRTAHITDITITPDSENRSLVSFSLTINIYLKP